ncbi:ATP-grasp domain-containing protein [Solicola sp. PLA-1-18]|uniref:ATP-grasp domain-containing protein n=1 Tax=Solicola sp. PLA-1-18 TaxID=3380532 RepID=UPI003B7968BD
MSVRIALATAREVADLDDEGKLLASALRERGADVTAAVWDDAGVDWSGFDLVVVRSTWDYATRVAEFLAWAEDVEAVTGLANPLPLLRWTTDKHYLLDLADAGVPIVPSEFLEPGDDPTHGLLDVEHVVKPAVSAGSKDTLLLGAHEADRSRAHAARLLDEGRSVLVQPYVAEVDEAGETAVVTVDGDASHAIRKGAILQRGGDLVEGLFAPEDITAREPSDDEVAVAERALAAVPGGVTPLYARVDLLPTPDGPVVLELEMAEPSLFLGFADGAADRLADAVLRRA